MYVVCTKEGWGTLDFASSNNPKLVWRLLALAIYSALFSFDRKVLVEAPGRPCWMVLPVYPWPTSSFLLFNYSFLV